MSVTSIETQLVKYLTDAHSIEEQALVQMRKAPDLAGAPELAQAFRLHLEETKEHERLIRERLAALGAGPSMIKDVVMKLGGGGFTMFARTQPDTPGKLAAHAYSYEHLELAAYELLMRVAERGGDHETAQLAQHIRDQEQRMATRLAGMFDTAVDASLDKRDTDDVEALLVTYLADAHAIEMQSLGLLKRARSHTRDELRRVYDEHFQQTERQRRLVDARLEAHGARSSALKDAAMRLGALNWGMFFLAQPDTPGKLAAFAFAFEHLEIAGYEQLKRVAVRAGDRETAEAAESILSEERAAAAQLMGAFDLAVEASLDAHELPRDER